MAELYIRGKDGRPRLIGSTADPQLPGRVTALEERVSKGILVPLTQDKTIYVNASAGSDTLDDGRGESEGKPFRSVQAAINYAAATYNLGAHDLYISPADGTYTGDVRLVRYASATGRMILRGNLSDAGAVSIEGGLFAGYGTGKWTVRNVAIRNRANTPSIETGNYYGISSRAGSFLTLIQCSVDVSAAAPDGFGKNVFFNVGGFVEIRTSGGGKPGLAVISGGAEDIAHIFYAEEGGIFSMLSDIQLDAPATVSTLYLRGRSYFRRGNALAFFKGDATGKRYDVGGNSVVSTLGGGPDFIPGSTEGTVCSGGQYE